MARQRVLCLGLWRATGGEYFPIVRFNEPQVAHCFCLAVQFQMLHHHHLARDEGATFVVVASLTTQAEVGRPPAVREASLIATELSYWLSFLQSIRSASQDEKPLEVCVVLTHLDCCGEEFVAQSHVDEVRVELQWLVGDWIVELPMWCINSFNPNDCTPPLDWLAERHAPISSNAAHIPRLCKELEVVLNGLRAERPNKASVERYFQIASCCCCSS